MFFSHSKQIPLANFSPGFSSFKINGSDLLLDNYPAAAAYSLRKLRTGQTNCIRIRRDSDNIETDIGFIGDGLDETAIISFCGSANGFLVFWYDATTSALDATQGVFANQPKIYDGITGVIKDSGKPSLYFDGISSSLQTNLTQSTGDFSFWSIFNPEVDFGDNQALICAGDIFSSGEFAVNIQAASNDSRFSIFGATANDSRYNNVVTINHQFQRVIASCTANGLITTTKKYSIGSCTTIRPTQCLKGYLQEMVLFNSNQTTNRTAIETDINNYWGVY